MAIYRIPWETDDTSGGNEWSFGTGNWDDPTHPHQPGADYPWGSAYAIDFGRPVNSSTKIGGRVRAARAGLVTEVRDTIGPYPVAGSPAGGNYVTIQHVDGSVGAYAHLAQNRVHVTVGEWVPQGYYIADSGDTGNTNGDGHLHFSVLTYYIDDGTYGPTLPLHYEATSASNWTGTPTDPNLDPDPHFFRGRNVTTVVTSPIYFRQDGWRICGKCQGLYFESLTVFPPVLNSASVCPTDLGPHSRGGSGNYQLVSSQIPKPVNAQSNWRWCQKCGILFYPNAGSKCPADGFAHDPTSSGDYMPILDIDDASNLGQAQSQWRYCSKCKGMFFGPNKAISVCPVSSQHDDSESGNYFLKVNVDDVQRRWRRCGKCHSIFYKGDSVSYCPVTTPETSHTAAADNRDYIMTIDSDDAAPGLTNAVPAPQGQQEWRHCNRCGGLWYGPNIIGSVCPAPGGGNHSSADSADYALVKEWSGNLNTYATQSPGEAGWRWCSKCQGLWLGSQSGSRCPKDGFAHSVTGSANYMLQYSVL
jgi:hypothetical protein